MCLIPCQLWCRHGFIWLTPTCCACSNVKLVNILQSTNAYQVCAAFAFMSHTALFSLSVPGAAELDRKPLSCCPALPALPGMHAASLGQGCSKALPHVCVRMPALPAVHAASLDNKSSRSGASRDCMCMHARSSRCAGRRRRPR
jgi:hypothetical protein